MAKPLFRIEYRGNYTPIFEKQIPVYGVILAKD